jgi:trehalose 6-phosphate phosphatase
MQPSYLAYTLRKHDPSEIMLLCDFDGTLAPIVSRPEDARAIPKSLLALESLSKVLGFVAIVSGRDEIQLSRLIKRRGIFLFGNHGSTFLLSPNEQLNLVQELNVAAYYIQQAISAFPGSWVERKRLALTIHFRDCESPTAAMDHFKNILMYQNWRHLNIRNSRMALELVPIAANKGLLVTRLIKLCKPSVVVFIGDDFGDYPVIQLRGRVRSKFIGCMVVNSEVPSYVYSDALVKFSSNLAVANFLDYLRVAFKH